MISLCLTLNINKDINRDRERERHWFQGIGSHNWRDWTSLKSVGLARCMETQTWVDTACLRHNFFGNPLILPFNWVDVTHPHYPGWSLLIKVNWLYMLITLHHNFISTHSLVFNWKTGYYSTLTSWHMKLIIMLLNNLIFLQSLSL